MRASLFEPFTAIDLPLADRRDGKVRASWACGDDQRLIVTTDRLSAFDRVLAGVPYKGQVLNELSAWWFECTADVIANHVIAVPDPNALLARAARPLPVEVVVRGHITGVTDTSLWGMYSAGARQMYGYRFPDGLTKNTALPNHIVTPDHQGRARRPRRAAVVRRGRRARAAARRALGAGDGGRAGDLRPRCRGRPACRADPRRHQVRVRAHARRRADPDRRGAHARLVALVGRRHLRLPARRRCRAGEPRQGGRPAGVRRPRLQGRRAGAGAARRGVVGDLRPLHRRLRTDHRSTVRTRRLPRRRPPRPSTSRKLGFCDHTRAASAHRRRHPARGVRGDRDLDAAWRRGGRDDVLRVVRVATSRAGGRRHRRQRRAAGAAAQGRGAGRHRLHAGRAGAAHRLPLDRPHPLLDDRLQCPAQHPALPGRDHARPARRRPQRQHRQRHRAARRAADARLRPHRDE